MGAEKRIAMMAREQNRDISEKVALGLAKPTQNAETMYDSRLFNQTSGFNSGFNEDQHYDKPLFAAQEAANRIYRPTVNDDDDLEGEGGAEGEMERIRKGNRFEALGRAKQGFKGAEEQGLGGGEREAGPVVFEKDKDDPFGIDEMIGEVRKERGEKRYGLEQAEEGRERERKRRRRGSDED
jgi:SNW domain-containing protein 1